MIVDSLKIEGDTLYTKKASGRADKIYPSVECGPIDITKA
jgi:hypothetical protein